jgi:hypothetical protein
MRTKKTSLFTKKYLQKLRDNEPSNSLEFYKVYSLVDPTSREIFYIGCTKEEIHKRVYCHSVEVTCGPYVKVSKNEKLRELLDKEIEPIVEVMYFIKDKEIARIIEKHLIHFCSNNKYSVNLLNRINSFSVSPC